MIWNYVVNWWNTSNPVRWISNAVWLQAALLQNCGLHMAIHIWLQSFRIRHPFWRPQSRGRHWSHACSWATKYLWIMNKKGAMVRDSNSLQSSCKADAALVDHVRLRSCFISPSIPVAPNARFSVPPMHVTGRTRGESNPTVTQLPPGTSASKSTHGGHSIQLGKCLKMVRFEATAPRTPYSHFVRKEQLKPSLTAGFRKIACRKPWQKRSTTHLDDPLTQKRSFRHKRKSSWFRNMTIEHEHELNEPLCYCVWRFVRFCTVLNSQLSRPLRKWLSATPAAGQIAGLSLTAEGTIHLGSGSKPSGQSNDIEQCSPQVSPMNNDYKYYNDCTR